MLYTIDRIILDNGQTWQPPTNKPYYTQIKDLSLIVEWAFNSVNQSAVIEITLRSATCCAVTVYYRITPKSTRRITRTEASKYIQVKW